MRVIEAGWYQQLEDEGLKITFLPAQHWSKRSVRDGGQRLWELSCYRGMVFLSIIAETQGILPILGNPGSVRSSGLCLVRYRCI